ncbi:MAG: hypothetical protein JWP91_3664 [Fibrobacteres bacterium]|nr:hypothetical protein [Fibrobacterota bacterium]
MNPNLGPVPDNKGPKGIYGRFAAILIALIPGVLGIALADHRQIEGEIAPEVKVEDEIPPKLPFNLGKIPDLEQVRIKLAFLSAKSGAGTQEITLSGVGHVRLSFSRSMQDKSPRILERDCDAETTTRLLDFMEGAGILDMEDQIGGEPKGRSLRVLELTLPDRVKRISVVGTGPDPLERIWGAAQLAAGQCLPEALNHRLFPDL